MMCIEKSWYEVLKEELQKPYVENLKAFLQSEKNRGFQVFPKEEEVFNAFRYTPYHRVKVVLMGQDPYHGDRQAHGLCFSVRKGVPLPPSLKNIYKELQDDLGMNVATHGCLESWAKQGVLLLNATLTVRKGAPKSHFGQGWEVFTDAVIKTLCERTEPLVFVLWGKSAQSKCTTILNTYTHPHSVLIAAHPSPYSASHFFGCRHFSKTNAILKQAGIGVIDWSVPE